ncbi:hypothetical protein [Sphingobium sp. YR657]|uniref:hypothetical protein n=1 Tax=Sphingobium sp. YR657 TaxID=1884366 RepID=UPI001114D301|nr:hypothetical protein [Sphingobium sp. YR657]
MSTDLHCCQGGSAVWLFALKARLRYSDALRNRISHMHNHALLRDESRMRIFGEFAQIHCAWPAGPLGGIAKAWLSERFGRLE